MVSNKDNQKMFETALASFKKMKHVRLFFSVFIIKKQAIHKRKKSYAFQTIQIKNVLKQICKNHWFLIRIYTALQLKKINR